MKILLQFILSTLHCVVFVAWIVLAMYVPASENVSGPGFGILMCVGTLISWAITFFIYFEDDIAAFHKMLFSALHTLFLSGIAIGAYYHIPTALAAFLKDI